MRLPTINLHNTPSNSLETHNIVDMWMPRQVLRRQPRIFAYKPLRAHTRLQHLGHRPRAEDYECGVRTPIRRVCRYQPSYVALVDVSGMLRCQHGRFADSLRCSSSSNAGLLPQSKPIKTFSASGSMALRNGAGGRILIHASPIHFLVTKKSATASI